MFLSQTGNGNYPIAMWANAMEVIILQYIFVLNEHFVHRQLTTCSTHISGVAVFLTLQPSCTCSHHQLAPRTKGSVHCVIQHHCTLNPLIYSLWNKDVKYAPNKILNSTKCSLVESVSLCHIGNKPLFYVLGLFVKFLEIL